MRRISILTLGCDKNRVDSEQLATILEQSGIEVKWCESIDESSEVLIINTCGFILPAQKQSIQTILEALNLKRQRKIRNIYVMGCLVKRFKTILQKELPEIDGWFDPEDFASICRALNISCHIDASIRSFISTPRHIAYIKISEGCNRKCSFCTIPAIRGRLRSKPIELIVKEVTGLLQKGTREIILVSQDTSSYGIDIYGKPALTALLERLGKINLSHNWWLRIHYLHPRPFQVEILDFMEDTQHPLVPYIDMPVQHASDNVLRAMRRGTPLKYLDKIIEIIRNKAPHAAFRTTIITGFPVETEKDFNLLIDKLREWKPERLSIFPYYHEEGSHSWKTLKDSVPRRIKQQRAKLIRQIYLKELLPSAHERQKKVFHNQVPVIADSASTGRTCWDSPDIDCTAWLPEKTITPGTITTMQIDDYDSLDLYMSPVKAPSYSL